MQWGLRLLVTQGSRLLELDDIRARRRQPFDSADADLSVAPRRSARRCAAGGRSCALVGVRTTASRRDVFAAVCALAGAAVPTCASHAARARATIPYLERTLVLLSGAQCRAGGSGVNSAKFKVQSSKCEVDETSPLLATTTGYQTRMFGEAAERLGVKLVFATDRCDQLDDPWWDGAIPIRFHQEAAVGRRDRARRSRTRRSTAFSRSAIGRR